MSNSKNLGAGAQGSGLKSDPRTKWREANREWLYNYLLEHPCVDCGEEDPVVLEFDHIEQKNISISKAVNQWSLKRIKEEIEHCEVRCANCHKRATALDQNWTMAKLHYGVDKGQ